ncbi:MAG: hypothetical protein PHU93_01845 [Candidatus Gracilibacteria bacterium]|nr:hypothetical protein [Candidatus Gracilibacteria bacterium]
MENFQLQTYLTTAPLGDEAKYNLKTIFHTLSDARKIEILGNWPKYLDMLLKIEQKGKEERDKNIAETLQKIENIISDGLERDRQKNKELAKKMEQQQEDILAAEQYDQQKKNEDFQKKLREIQQVGHTASVKTNPIFDPLGNLLLLITFSVLLTNTQVIIQSLIG